MKIEILESARRDLVEGFYFYEKQADGIGTYFLDSLYLDIDSLADNAGMHPVCFQVFHRLLSAHFPFAIYYKVLPKTVVVYAVLDCRRKPAWIRSRLNK